MSKYYADVLKAWQVKTMGQKPTADLFEAAHALGCREGVQALHIAMVLRAEGCTVAQFCTAGSCGPANNKRRELINHKLITVTVAGKPYAYVGKLTAKGEKQITAFKAKAAEAAAEAKAKPAKGKAKAKGVAKKVKAAKAQPTPQTAPVTVPVSPDTLDRGHGGGEVVTA